MPARMAGLHQGIELKNFSTAFTKPGEDLQSKMFSQETLMIAQKQASLWKGHCLVEHGFHAIRSLLWGGCRFAAIQATPAQAVAFLNTARKNTH